ncbi:hypothetical protein QG37_00753 [Candidozyma auris]|uniref:Uncharacterized protein n=1 Tax=Candidozyma auris TaxID=498019 RepID=A0A0L0P6T8_CANAR|nr:hypothetical protein QG37_00753 [[Candida] auris]
MNVMFLISLLPCRKYDVDHGDRAPIALQHEINNPCRSRIATDTHRTFVLPKFIKKLREEKKKSK